MNVATRLPVDEEAHITQMKFGNLILANCHQYLLFFLYVSDDGTRVFQTLDYELIYFIAGIWFI